MRKVNLLLSFAIITALATVSIAQPAGGRENSPREAQRKNFDRSAPDVGESLPDVTLYDSDGNAVPLTTLKDHYTVLVFGCLT